MGNSLIIDMICEKVLCGTNFLHEAEADAF